MPKKLSGRPKRLRRRENWEGESQSRSQAKGINVVKGLQKMTSGKTMHCSDCRQSGHKKPKCPLPEQVSVDPEQVSVEVEQVPTDKNQMPNESEQVTSQATKSRVSKLPVRRNNSEAYKLCEPSQTSKGKEKVIYKIQRKRQERPFWMQSKRQKNTGQNVVGHETVDVGHKQLGQIFMPNPGFVKAAHKPNGNPSADIPPIHIKKLQGDQDLVDEEEQTEDCDDKEEQTEEDDDEEKTEEDDQVQFSRKATTSKEEQPDFG